MSIIERGKAELDQRQVDADSKTQALIAQGQRELREKFVTLFYPETLVSLQSSSGIGNAFGYGLSSQKLGPESPDPQFIPDSKMPNKSWDEVPWIGMWEDIRYRAQHLLDRYGRSQGLAFFVWAPAAKPGKARPILSMFLPTAIKYEWHRVRSPGDVVRALHG